MPFADKKRPPSRPSSVMLDRYILSSPTIGEKLSFSYYNGAKTVADRTMEVEEDTRRYLEKWEASYQKGGQA